MTELVLTALYYGLWLALFLVIALLVFSAYFLLKSAWKRKGKIWPIRKRTKGKRKGRSKPKSALWKRVAAAHGVAQSFGLMVTFFSGGIVAIFLYGHEGPLATIVAVVMFAIVVGFLALAVALFRVVWRG